GGDLFDAITRSVRFSEEVASKMVFDMASALYYLHSRSIMHRDLKPENFLVLRHRDGRVTLKLADFGLAMEVNKPEYTICGTPTYIAPEILLEVGYGLPVDIWALGVITYILLCGFPPFKGVKKSQTDLFRRIKEGTFEFVRPYWDRISSPAMNMILRTLVVDQKRRCQAIDILQDPWVYSNGKPPLPTDPGFDVFETSRQAYRDELESYAKRIKCTTSNLQSKA
ncbi:Serine/threonine-protein kinase dclk3, partial [Cichlidogyrus casuarinus]